MNNDLEKLVADGFSIGYSRQHSMLDEAVDFAPIAHRKPGNLCLRHSKILVITIPASSLDCEGYAWGNLLAMNDSSLTITLGSQYVWAVFKLGSFETFKAGRLPIGKFAGATLSNSFMVGGAKVMGYSFAETKIVEGCTEIKPMPTAIKDELQRLDFFYSYD